MPETQVDSRGRILLADDEETFLHATGDLFRQAGFDCECVPDASTALARLDQDEFDLLVADIRMPGNAEMEMVAELTSRRQGMPVIIVTGHPSLASALQSIELPVSAYLLKPVKFDDLLERARRSIRSYRTWRALSETRQRALEMLAELDRAGPGEDLLQTFVSLTLRNITQGLFDLQNITSALAGRTGDQDPCRLLSCPRRVEMRTAIQDAVETLESTRSSFRSRTLEELRLRLEAALARDRNPYIAG